MKGTRAFPGAEPEAPPAVVDRMRNGAGMESYETPPTSSADTQREARVGPPSPPNAKPSFETYWTITSAGYGMTAYYRNIMEASDRARALYDQASKSARHPAQDDNVPLEEWFEEWMKLSDLCDIRRTEKEAKEKAWEEARIIANQLKKMHQQSLRRRTKRAEKRRLKKRAKRT